MPQKIFTKESILLTIAESLKSVELEGARRFPITSCHSALGYWIATEDRLESTDEIVLLGPDKDVDTVFHSILMRGDDIIGDTERVSEERGIDTQYDMETGEYKTKRFRSSPDDVTYYTLMRMTVADFRAQYLGMDGPDASEDPPEPL